MAPQKKNFLQNYVINNIGNAAAVGAFLFMWNMNSWKAEITVKMETLNDAPARLSAVEKSTARHTDMFLDWGRRQEQDESQITEIKGTLPKLVRKKKYIDQ